MTNYNIISFIVVALTLTEEERGSFKVDRIKIIEALPSSVFKKISVSGKTFNIDLAMYYIDQTQYRLEIMMKYFTLPVKVQIKGVIG